MVPQRGCHASWPLEPDSTGPGRNCRRLGGRKLAACATERDDGGSDAGRATWALRRLYRTFANAWRVNGKDSLFDYAQGTSTNSFTIRDWPPEKPPCTVRGEKPLEPGSETLAHAACRGIEDQNRRADCIFDVRATGDPIFAKSYVATQRILADSTTTSLTADADPTQIGEWVTFTVSVVANSGTATGIPSGTIQFAVDGFNVGEPVNVNSKGGAIWATSQLKVGTHRITASYVPGADSVFLPSTSLEKLHTVKRCYCDAEHENK